jgi:hypothetical protein
MKNHVARVSVLIMSLLRSNLLKGMFRQGCWGCIQRVAFFASNWGKSTQNKMNDGEISGYHVGEYKDNCLLRCCAV